MTRILPTAFVGGMIAIALCALAFARGTHGGPSIVAAWIAVGFAVPILALLAAFAPRLPGRLGRLAERSGPALLLVGVAAALSGAGWLAVVDHRRYAVVLGIVQGLAFLRLAPRGTAPSTSLAVGAMSVAAWSAGVGIAYTAFDNVLTGVNRATGLAPLACVLALVLFVADATTTHDAAVGETRGERRRRGVVLGAAIVAFAWCAFRTDAFSMDWISYHRDFFTAPAEFIRQGALPLWDMPSQYGILSEIVLALIPTRTTWEGLYLATAVVLVVQATIVFVVLRTGRRGAINGIAAFVAAGAPFFTSAAWRDPFGPRLYPQGGLRFVFLYLLVGAALCIALDPAHARRWRRIGFLVWGLGIAWSFENAVWSTLVWGGFIVCERVLEASRTPDAAQRFRRFTAGTAPLIVIPAAVGGTLTLAYAAYAHHGVDWTGLIEFSVAFSTRPENALLFAPTGPIWILPFFLAGPAALGVVLIRAKRTAMLPLVVAAWFLVWATASYYVGEPFSDHVNLLAGNFIFAAAIVELVIRRERLGAPFASVIGAATIPLLVVIVATGSGELRELVRGPFAAAHPFDASAGLPTIPTELAELEHRAGIAPTDRVLFPSSPAWVTYGAGLISPFVVDARGVRREQTGWFLDDQPGMINQLLELPPARRSLYRERFLDRSRSGGWLVTYDIDPACSQLSPRLRNSRIVRTANFAATYCRFVP